MSRKVRRGIKCQVNYAFLVSLTNEVDREFLAFYKATNQELTKLFNTPESIDFFKANTFAVDASFFDMVTRALDTITKKFTARIKTFSSAWSKKLVTGVNTQTSLDVTRLLDPENLTIKIPMSDRTKNIMKSRAIEAQDLIVTTHDRYAQELKSVVVNSMIAPDASREKFMKEFEPLLKDEFKKHRNKALNVAMDQTRKCYQWTSASKMMDAGIKKFIWHHTDASKDPRDGRGTYKEDHVIMDGKIYEYANPPIVVKRTGERGFPATAINCKCYAEPVVEFD